MALLDLLLSSPPADNPPSVPPQITFLAEYVLYPFYDCIVQYYPTTWVPNKVTLTGIFATLLASLLLLTAMPPETLFDPPFATFTPALLLTSAGGWKKSTETHLSAPTPIYLSVLQPYFSGVFGSATSMLIVCGLLNLVYCIADNTDGRLARRLRKCSHIGEYLDHGLDCVTSLLSTCVAMGVLGVPFANIAVTVVPIAIVTLLSHTLHYERNVFIWGNRIVSIDEAMIFFSVANWLPIVFPNIGVTKIAPWVLQAVVPVDKLESFLALRYIDIAVCVYYIAQYQVIIGIVMKNFKMLFRITTLAMLWNVLLLLGAIPFHTAHILAHGPAGYAWGPFSYVAVWIITTAATCSTIVHILIHARCARLPQVSPLPFSGLVFVWLVFPLCPLGGMVLSVIWHIAQIFVNAWHIEESAIQREKREKQK